MAPPQDALDATRALQWFLSAVGGALVTFVAFRTKIALMDREIADRKKEIADESSARKAAMHAMEKKIDDKLERIERHSIEQLRMTADIARAVGADKRFTDAVLRMLADDGKEGNAT